MKHNRTNLLFLLTVLQVALLSLPLSAEPCTNLYETDSFGPSDDGSYFVNRYAQFLNDQRLRVKQGLRGPLPEELPSHLDTNGCWGLVGAGFQLAVRFQQPEFRVGEPVAAFVYVRNVSSPLEAVYIKKSHNPGARKNFSFLLRQGERTNQWSWTEPPPPAPGIQPVYPVRVPYPYLAGGVLRNKQMYFVVRVDQVFDLSKPGEYSIQATWPVRAGKLGIFSYADPVTNQVHISTGFAKFRIVPKPQ